MRRLPRKLVEFGPSGQKYELDVTDDGALWNGVDRLRTVDPVPLDRVEWTWTWLAGWLRDNAGAHGVTFVCVMGHFNLCALPTPLELRDLGAHATAFKCAHPHSRADPHHRVLPDVAGVVQAAERLGGADAAHAAALDLASGGKRRFNAWRRAVHSERRTLKAVG